MKLTDIYRFPVKGLAGERLEVAELATGRVLPGDRTFAIAHGGSTWNPAEPAWQPKSAFVTLLKTEKLARLACRYDPGTGQLAIYRDGKRVVGGDMGAPIGRAMIDQLLSAYLGDVVRGPIRLADGGGTALSDVPAPYLSLINRASVLDLERVTRAPTDPRRFRGNLVIEGGPAWAERRWPGKELGIGGAVFDVVEPISRCGATNVNPATAGRDMNIPLDLTNGFGHVEMGVYVRVIAGGAIAVGDDVRIQE